MSQSSPHTTRTGRKGTWLLITALIILLCTVPSLLLGVHLGRQGFQISGITVIPKPLALKSCPPGTVACGIGTAVHHTLNRTEIPASTSALVNPVPEIYGPYRGVVDLAHDGDTVNIRLDLGFDITIYSRVRVKGINSPELSTEAGKTARDFAQKVLPPGTAVLVTSYGWDKYGGRIDGRIMLVTPYKYNGLGEYTNFAQLMLDSGNAVPYLK